MATMEEEEMFVGKIQWDAMKMVAPLVPAKGRQKIQILKILPEILNKKQNFWVS